MKRKGASCLECQRLHTLCPPDVRNAILSETVEVANYAAWGCTKYRGPAKMMLKGIAGIVYNGILDGETYTSQTLSDKLSMDRQVVQNNISRLIAKGVNIKKERINGQLYYRLEKTLA